MVKMHQNNEELAISLGSACRFLLVVPYFEKLFWQSTWAVAFPELKMCLNIPTTNDAQQSGRRTGDYNNPFISTCVLISYILDGIHTAGRKLGSYEIFAQSYVESELCLQQLTNVFQTTVNKIQMLLQAEFRIHVGLYKNL